MRFIVQKSEAQKSFGNSEVYIERYIDNPKHIEVQVIGDEYGNIVHLYMSVIVLSSSKGS